MHHLILFDYLLQVTIEVLYVFAQAVIYGILVYAMIGFEWTVAKFFWYLFFMFFTCLYFTFYGMMGVALTPNQHVAAITCNAFYALWNLFSGFIIPRTVSVACPLSFYYCKFFFFSS